MPQGINLVSFDFSGCGNSQGDWVTLGWKEVHDLKAVLAYLHSLGTVSKVALWGRSMGAATALMFLAENQDKAQAVVVDSCFSSFQDVVNHLAANQFGIPAEFVTMLMFGV